MQDDKEGIEAESAPAGVRPALVEPRESDSDDDDPHVHHAPKAQTSFAEAAVLVDRALAAEPTLTHFGLGVYGESRVREDAVRNGQNPRAVVAAMISKGQRELRANLGGVAAAADWIKQQRTTKVFTSTGASYGYKHKVEAWFRTRGNGGYVSNGAFIAAAIGLGIPYCPAEGTPNVYFKLSKKTARETQEAAEAVVRQAKLREMGIELPTPRRGRRHRFV